ncbi:MAG: hypothetical protein K5654_03725 [Lachnospiraceae bacterium]|nr:hypothetical protein [Lachnospiraceae bacterium]
MKLRKDNIYKIICICMLLLLTACLVFVSQKKYSDSKRLVSEIASDKNVDVKIGDTPISEYRICFNTGAGEAARVLKKYIDSESGTDIKTSFGKPTANCIYVCKAKGNRGIKIEDGIITISGSDSSECLEEVYVFANMYLGYAFAGEEREHILENVSYSNIPKNVRFVSEPWMSNREPIVCLWKTDTVRGIYTDRNISLKSELMMYSDDELYQYVKMMKALGFTGIQVTDMCSTWAQYGGYEYVQDRIRFMADSAHSLDMKFTLWVWGAEFNGYGWVDKSVKYIDYSHLSQEDEECIATFEKYYSIYAQLADCSDRVIMHFNDPGNLYSSKDIGYFAEMFRQKCIAINPDIDFGLSCYRHDNNIDEIKEYIPKGTMIYSGVAHTEDEQETYKNYSNWIATREFRRGIWSWNLAEMEIDQLSEMNVNAKVIAETYRLTRDAGELVAPEYWSEMDSYHLLNIFSLYCSGNLLQDTTLNEDELLREISERVVGIENEDTLYESLNIIQDARSGEHWDEFKIKDSDSYILLSKDYPAEDLVKRCDEVIPKMQELADKELKENTVPLPIPTSDLIALIIPHLEQIRKYAEFRIALDKGEDMLKNGKDKETIQKYIDGIYTPIPTYNTITGCWGQVEARSQYILLERFCSKADIEIPRDDSFDDYRKKRIYGEMIVIQENSDAILSFDKRAGYQLGIAFGNDETERLINELVDDGLLVDDGDGRVHISDWNRENLIYSFD